MDPRPVRRALTLVVPFSMAVATLVGAGGAAAAPAFGAGGGRHIHSCAAPGAGYAACGAVLETPGGAPGATSVGMTRGKGGGGHPAATPSGYGPSDLQSAYALATAAASKGSGQTVGIVDAYNDPNVASDLAVYRSTYGLPACTVSSGCLKVVNQNGGSRLPAKNGGWSQEISLDVDMVSAVCPNCHILLVEASTPSLTNLGTAVNTAVRLGATEVSNSYGGSESSSDPSYDSTYFDHPGVAITAAAGDNGYGVGYPAASQYVTSVGGTSLTRSSGARGWSETAWSGTGSGCSVYDPQPSWQSSAGSVTGCANRVDNDVAAVADPNTGVAVYDSYSYQGYSGWLVFGGTSVATPIIASVYALAGNASSVDYGSYPYSHTGSLNDVTSGSDGSCGGSLLCTAAPGYDGPTGLGTPAGTGAF